MAYNTWCHWNIDFSAARWLNKCGIIWLTLFGNSLPKELNLGPEESLLVLQWLFDQQFSKSLKSFSCIWFFLRSSIPWIIWHQHNDLVFNSIQWHVEKHAKLWDSLLDYRRLEWQCTLLDLEKTLDIAYDDLKKFDKIWCVKGLIITRNNIVLTWKVTPWMSIIS